MNRLCFRKLFLAGLFLILTNGCSEIRPPTPNEILHQPLGESPLRVGMTQEKVKSLWGSADEVIVLGSVQGIVKEEWIYRGRYPNLPINIDYLAETQHLFFDGAYLVRFYHQK